jgi:hypothetical protein
LLCFVGVFVRFRAPLRLTITAGAGVQCGQRQRNAAQQMQQVAATPSCGALVVSGLDCPVSCITLLLTACPTSMAVLA